MIKNNQFIQDSIPKSQQKPKTDLNLPKSKFHAFMSGVFNPNTDYYDYIGKLKGNTIDKQIVHAIKTKDVNWLVRLLKKINV